MRGLKIFSLGLALVLSGVIGPVNASGTVNLTETRQTIAPGADYTCAIDAKGAVKCWGKRTTVPNNIGSAVLISEGYDVTCIVNSSRRVHCWRFTSDQIQKYTPFAFDYPNIKQIEVGDKLICLVTFQSSLTCNSSLPKIPQTLNGITQVSIGKYNMCAINLERRVECYGDNPTGQNDVPSDLKDVIQITTSEHLSCALTSQGTVRCWGFKNNPGFNEVPSDLTDVVQVGAGVGFTCALKRQGSVRCWSPAEFTELTPPANLGKTTQIFVGVAHVCATSDKSEVRCWGYNNAGQTDVPISLGKVSSLLLTLPKSSSPKITGTLKTFQVLTATPGLKDSGAVFGYQWLRNGLAISKATSNKYKLTAKDKSKKISVRVTIQKTGFKTVTQTSPSVIPK